MARAATRTLEEAFPLLGNVIGNRFEARAEEFDRLGIAPLVCVERDLAILARKASLPMVTRAYRDLLRNPGHFVEAMYEIRAAAMLAPLVEALDLAPRVGRRACDLRCSAGGQEIFLEVATREDRFPPAYDLEVYSRETVEKSFGSGMVREEPRHDAIPASHELRQRIVEEAGQLPAGVATVVVLGSTGGRLGDLQDALWGDEITRVRQGNVNAERVPNGLFEVDDDLGGVSKLSAVVWLRLAKHFQDVKAYGRVFTNRRAAVPIAPAAMDVLEKAFDRRAILVRELERIRAVLIERYRPERIIVFGSLARALDDDSADAVHEWSDIDLVVVKRVGGRFVERVQEVLDLVQSTVGLNVLVYTPEEMAAAEREGNFFVRDEILGRGWPLSP
jgi:predicted nucleotidyltransferase